MLTSFERKRSVCIFCEKWGCGGIESFLLNYLEQINFAQVEITIVAAAVESTLFFSRLEQLHIPLHTLSGNYRSILKNHTLFLEFIKKNSFDVIHMNTFVSTSILYLAVAKILGVPKRILHSHNNQLRISMLRPLKQILHEIGKKFGPIVTTDYWACSESAAQFMFPPKAQSAVRIIKNGILLDRFLFRADVRSDVRKELGIDNQLVIGNVGRLCYQKNQTFMLRILKEVLSMRSDVCLLLIGGGDQTELTILAQQLGIQESVRFLGTTNQIERYLWAMDLFLFPSKFEGLGIAALEAQAAGLPVIASDILPDEVKVTPLFHEQSLACNTKEWAVEILCRTESRSGHMENLQTLREAGYDMSCVAQTILEAYLS